MRLNRLELIRYGRFQDSFLDFGSAPGERDRRHGGLWRERGGQEHGVHRVARLLFGFQGGASQLRVSLRSQGDAGRRGSGDARRGAELAAVGGERRVADRCERPCHFGAAAGGWLFGLDREAYRTRFSLNDTILRVGGEEIAKAQGDLGQLLHAGSSGLAGLSEALAKVEGEVEAFHKKGGRKTAANEGRNRLRELDAELRQVRLDPRSFDRLLKARDDADAAFGDGAGRARDGEACAEAA